MSAGTRAKKVLQRAAAAGRSAARPLLAGQLARSGMIDLDFYAAQTGLPFAGAGAAARHYLAEGAASGFTPHPLFEAEYLDGRQASGGGEVALRFLAHPEDFGAASPHPLFDPATAQASLGSDRSVNAWLDWVRMARPDTPVPVPTGTPPISWGVLRTLLLEAAVEWRRTRIEREEPPPAMPGDSPSRQPSSRARRVIDWRTAAGAKRTRDLISVIVPVVTDLTSAAGWVGRLDGPAVGLELVYVGLSTRAQYCTLTALAHGRSVVVDSEQETTWAALCNLGALASSGDILVLVKPGTVTSATDVRTLGAATERPGTALVQPLNERIDMTVATAGAYFPPGDVVPSPLLAGHPVSDAERIGDAELPAAQSGVVAVRADDFIAERGLDPGFGNTWGEVDLSLRLRANGKGAIRLVTGARATARSQERAGLAHDRAASAALLRARWATTPPGSEEVLGRAGFTVVAHKAEALGGTQQPGQPAQVLVPQLAPTRRADGPAPVLRWAIDIHAPSGPRGELWGDRHFAYALAASLRKLGQQVAVDHREARDRATRKFDDVVLTLRGIHRVVPRPGPLNLLWVISHPDDVEGFELEAYDTVFAASRSWAQARSAASGVPIETLLQCTEPELFQPGLTAEGSGAPVLFVGNTRGNADRTVVDYALRAGRPPQIIGGGWERTAAAAHVVAPVVPNGELGVLYCGAGVVLNDHWPDMLANGFISNRLFDAVACGARVLSDRVPGAGDLFGGSVQFFDGPSDVARLLGDPDAGWPGADERLAIAARVREEHSFDRRAEVLLERALTLWGTRDGDGPPRREPAPPAG